MKKLLTRLFLAGLTLIVAANIHAGEKAKFNSKVNIGDAAPDWSDLIGIDDQRHSLADYADDQLLVLVFTCNHCPVAKAYESRLKSLVDDYAESHVRFIAVSCSRIPADSLEKMKTRAAERDFNFPYLQDLSQQIGEAYGAAVTPHVFVLDRERKIAYMGAIDDNLQIDKVKHHYLRDALEALVAGKLPEVAETKPKGCHIEYE